eukprot:GHUV01001570.1.p1 GENE.GHUV01001570.1~~GHUV01001570.1.p1  ORF type:complete len:566 (+),score=155.75 GHUV01001570.1:219-1916(+)
MAEVAHSTNARSPGAASSKMEQQSTDSMLLSMDDFKHFKQIGKGKDCVVYAAICDKLNGASVVLKVYDKSKISAIKQRSVRREARIMRYLTDKGVPHTTAYTGAFQDSKQIYIVMEHCSGGDLLEQLLREGRAMAEKRVVREVVLPTLTALAYIHAAGIIHRDIKLENLFISASGHLQLGDFGLAICMLEERAISPVGTLEYMPPEILRLPSTDSVVRGLVNVDTITPVDEKVDMWSFGVTVYELVTGRSPFEGSDKDEIRAAILGYKMRPLPGFLTSGCQDFILQCMCPVAADRPGAMQLLNHPWVQLHCTPADLVAVARLPLQLPKVPMGHKASSKRHMSPANSSSSNISSATAGQDASSKAGIQQAANAVDSVGPAVSGKYLASKGSAPGTPSSPQIPAYIPNSSSTSSVVAPPVSSSSSQGHIDSHAGTMSRDLSTGSSAAASMADSAASFYQSVGSGGGSAMGLEPNSHAHHQTLGFSTAKGMQGLGLAHQPISESPADESAAAFSSSDLQQQPAYLQGPKDSAQAHASGSGKKGGSSAGGKKLLKWMCLSPTSSPQSEA